MWKYFCIILSGFYNPTLQHLQNSLNHMVLKLYYYALIYVNLQKLLVLNSCYFLRQKSSVIRHQKLSISKICYRQKASAARKLITAKFVIARNRPSPRVEHCQVCSRQKSSNAKNLVSSLTTFHNSTSYYIYTIFSLVFCLV